MHEDFIHGKKTKAKMKNWTDALSVEKRVENSANRRHSMTREWLAKFHKGLDPDGKMHPTTLYKNFSRKKGVVSAKSRATDVHMARGIYNLSRKNSTHSVRSATWMTRQSMS